MLLEKYIFNISIVLQFSCFIQTREVTVGHVQILTWGISVKKERKEENEPGSYWGVIQLYLEKCTGRYFKVRDRGQYVNSKLLFKKFFKNILKYIFKYIYICYKIKT